jgi:hypothetical protein
LIENHPGKRGNDLESGSRRLFDTGTDVDGSESAIFLFVCFGAERNSAMHLLIFRGKAPWVGVR